MTCAAVVGNRHTSHVSTSARAGVATTLPIQPGHVVVPSQFGRSAAVLSFGEYGSRLLRPIPTSSCQHPLAGELAEGQHDRGTPGPVAGSSTTGSFVHVPVMCDEVIELLAQQETTSDEPVFVDATLGAGGHTEALLERLPHARVIGLDRDKDALAAARARLARFGDRVITHHLRFDRLATVVDPGSLAGVLFDLGVSSPQLDHADRGFSFRQHGPLDMRMDQSAPVTAAELVNEWPAADLARILWMYGDERQAKRIASAIVAARPIADTHELAEVVANALPAAVRRNTRQPAAKTFQALRIEVNSELDVIEPALLAAIDGLATGGRLVVLAYHSGEDRIVKRVLREESRAVTGRPDLPPPTGTVVRLELLFNGSRKPSAAELDRNSRATSARLRAAQRRGEA